MIQISPQQIFAGRAANANSAAIDASIINDQFDATKTLLGLVERHGQGARVSNRKPENIELIKKALSNLSTELLEKKSTAGRLVDTGLSYLPGTSTSRLRAATRANTESSLFNNQEVLTLITAMAREANNSTNLPMDIRDEARKTLNTWLNTTRLAGSAIEKDSTEIKRREQRAYTATDAVKQIITGTNQTERLRGAATIIELASKTGKKENSLSHYLDKIEDSFSPNGHIIREIVGKEVNDAIAGLPDLMKNPDLVMSEDISLVHDLKASVSQLIQHTGKSNRITSAFIELLNTDFDTKHHKLALDKIHEIIQDFSDQHSKFDKLHKGYMQIETELNSSENDNSTVRYEFMTKKQLQELATVHGLSVTGQTRARLITQLKASTSTNAATILVTRDNIDIANRLKVDAKNKMDLITNSFKKETDKLKKAFVELPSLATAFYEMVGPRLGMGITGTDEYHEIFPEQRKTLEANIKNEFKEEKKTLTDKIDSLEAQSRTINTKAQGQRTKLLSYIKDDLKLNEPGTTQSWLKALDSIRNERSNPHLDPLYEKLLLIKQDIESNGTVDDDTLVSTSHLLISFVQAEKELDQLASKTPLSTFKAHAGNIDPTSPMSTTDELYNASITVTNLERELANLSAKAEDAQTRIDRINKPEQLEEMVKSEMEAKFSSRVVNSYNALVHIGIITEQNLDKVVTDLEQTATYYRTNQSNFETESIGEVILAAFNYIVNLFKNGYQGALKEKE
ncbi:MAG: hypothetical protein HOA17_06175 [Candidatus Melainabacteria bacterium]|nr:hypothetical protein [Candidatus Melainabacteria bacterium]